MRNVQSNQNVQSK